MLSFAFWPPAEAEVFSKIAVTIYGTYCGVRTIGDGIKDVGGMIKK